MMLRRKNFYSLVMSVSIVLISQHFAFGKPANSLATDSSYGTFTAAKWAGNQKSAFSFSFDDGLKSQYDNVFSIFNQYGIIGTFFILPAYLTENLPGIWRYGTWPMFIELSENGNEIGSHSVNHLHMKTLPVGDPYTEGTIHYELYQSQLMINNRLGNPNCITFAYPYGEHNELVDSLTSIYYQFARALGEEPNSESPTANEWYFLKSYNVIFDFPRDVPEDDLDELYDFEDWISSSIDSGKWAIQLAHEVVPYNELADLISSGSYNPISNEWMSMLCDWLTVQRDDGKLWIETIKNISKYIKERESFWYEIVSANEQHIQIQLYDSLDNQIYNYPLTGFVKIPGSWEFVRFQQGSRIEILESFIFGSDTLVMADIIPDGGVATLSKYSPNYVEEETGLTPAEFVLYQNYPNPFNPVTNISFYLFSENHVTIRLYNQLGEEMNTLLDSNLNSGEHKLEFDASGLVSGIYFVRMKAGQKIQTIKIMLMK